MGMELPDWAGKTFLVVTGESWPEADETGLRRLAQAWDTYAARLEGVESDIAASGYAVRAVWQGDGADAFGNRIDELLQSGPLAEMRSGARQLGQFSQFSAVNVEYMKLSVLGQLAMLAVQIATLIPYLFVPSTAPAAGSMIATLKVLGQWIATNFYRRLALSLATAVVQQVGLDVAIQAYQMTRDRKEWTAQNTYAALAAAGIGTVLGDVLGRFGPKFLGHKFMESMMGQVLHGGLHEWATEAITQIIFDTGARPPAIWAAMAGAAEGFLDAVGGRSRGTFARTGVGTVDIAPITVPGAIDGDLTLEGNFRFDDTGQYMGTRQFDGVARITGTFTPAGGQPMTGTFVGRLTVDDMSVVANDSSRFVGTPVQEGTSFGNLRTNGSFTGNFTLEGQFTPSASPSSSPKIVEIGDSAAVGTRPGESSTLGEPSLSRSSSSWPILSDSMLIGYQDGSFSSDSPPPSRSSSILSDSTVVNPAPAVAGPVPAGPTVSAVQQAGVGTPVQAPAASPAAPVAAHPTGSAQPTVTTTSPSPSITGQPSPSTGQPNTSNTSHTSTTTSQSTTNPPGAAAQLNGSTARPSPTGTEAVDRAPSATEPALGPIEVVLAPTQDTGSPDTDGWQAWKQLPEQLQQLGLTYRINEDDVRHLWERYEGLRSSPFEDVKQELHGALSQRPWLVEGLPSWKARHGTGLKGGAPQSQQSVPAQVTAENTTVQVTAENAQVPSVSISRPSVTPSGDPLAVVAPAQRASIVDPAVGKVDEVSRAFAAEPPGTILQAVLQAAEQAGQQTITTALQEAPTDGSLTQDGERDAVWFTVTPQHPQGSPVDSYEVSSSGWFRLRTGELIRPGWIRAGDNTLVHRATGMELSLPDGVVTRADAELLNSVPPDAADDLIVAADLLGVYVSSPGQLQTEYLLAEVSPSWSTDARIRAREIAEALRDRNDLGAGDLRVEAAPGEFPPFRLTRDIGPPTVDVEFSEDGTVGFLQVLTDGRPKKSHLFLATADVVAHAMAALSRLGSQVKLEVEPNLSFQSHTSETLLLVKPVVPPTIGQNSRDFAAGVMGGQPLAVILGPLGSGNPLAPVSTQDGSEVSGVANFTQWLVDNVDKSRDETDWARARQIVGDSTSIYTASAPGKDYADLLRRASEDNRVASWLHEAGINEQAIPRRTGEAFVIQEVPTLQDNNRSYNVNYDGRDPVNGFGYHFGAALVTSRDGKTSITVETVRNLTENTSFVSELLGRSLDELPPVDDYSHWLPDADSEGLTEQQKQLAEQRKELAEELHKLAANLDKLADEINKYPDLPGFPAELSRSRLLSMIPGIERDTTLPPPILALAETIQTHASTARHHISHIFRNETARKWQLLAYDPSSTPLGHGGKKMNNPIALRVVPFDRNLLEIPLDPRKPLDLPSLREQLSKAAKKAVAAQFGAVDELTSKLVVQVSYVPSKALFGDWRKKPAEIVAQIFQEEMVKARQAAVKAMTDANEKITGQTGVANRHPEKPAPVPEVEVHSFPADQRPPTPAERNRIVISMTLATRPASSAPSRETTRALETDRDNQARRSTNDILSSPINLTHSASRATTESETILQAIMQAADRVRDEREPQGTTDGLSPVLGGGSTTSAAAAETATVGQVSQLWHEYAEQQGAKAYERKLEQLKWERARPEVRQAQFSRSLEGQKGISDWPRQQAAQFKTWLREFRTLDPNDPANLGEIAEWQRLDKHLKPLLLRENGLTPARATFRAEIEGLLGREKQPGDERLHDRAESVVYASEILAAMEAAREPRDNERGSTGTEPVRVALTEAEQEALRGDLRDRAQRKLILRAAARARAMVAVAEQVDAIASTHIDAAVKEGMAIWQAHRVADPLPADVQKAEEHREETRAAFLRVPTDGSSTQDVEWYTVIPEHPQGSRVDSYEVSSSGWFRLRTGELIPPGGWTRFEDVLVHRAAGVALGRASGFVAPADASLLDRVPADGGDGLTVTADILGLYVAQTPTGPADHLPLSVEPAPTGNAEPRSPGESWTGELTDGQLRMVETARRNAYRATEGFERAEALATIVFAEQALRRMPGEEATRAQRRTEEQAVRDLVDRVRNPEESADGDPSLAELAKAERAAQLGASHREELRRAGEAESARLAVAEELVGSSGTDASGDRQRQLARLGELTLFADLWDKSPIGVTWAVRQAVRQAVLDALDGGVEADLVPRLVDARMELWLAEQARLAAIEARAAAEQARVAEQQRQADQAELAVAAATYRLRDQQAQSELLADKPRHLPPWFAQVDPRTGEPVYALSHHGSLIFPGEAGLSSPEGLAQAVVQALPPQSDERLRTAVREALLTAMKQHEPRLVAQWMLETGYELSVTVDGTRHQVLARIGLGDLRKAGYVPIAHAERTDPGTGWHYMVNADNQQLVLTRQSVSNNRGIGLTVGGALKIPGVEVSFSAGIRGTGGTSYTQGFNEVSATHRLLVVGGKSVYFDFGDASISTEVTVAGSAAPVTGSLRQVIRAQFPLEFAPVRPEGAEGLHPSVPPTLPDARPIGVDPQVFTAARKRAEIGQATDDDERMFQQAEALDRVTKTVFLAPESAPGLGTLRDKVRRWLSQGDTRLSGKALRQLDAWLSEPTVLRKAADIFATGATSPLIVSGGHGFHVTTKATLLRAQAVSIDPVPLKEENQRFAATVNDITSSAGVSADVVRGKSTLGLGDSTAQTGGSGSVSGEFNLGIGRSRADSARPFNGSGEIRALVHPGESVLYRFTMQLDATVASTLPRLLEPGTSTDIVDFYVRIPAHERGRFEELLQRAIDEPSRTPQENSARPPAPAPDPAAPTRYAPAHLASGLGTGLTMAFERMPGAENVLPTVLELVRRAEAELDIRSDPMSEAALRLRLTQLSYQGLINNASQVLQPGGLNISQAVGVDGGMEYLTIQVTANRDKEPQLVESVERVKLELMPAALVGYGAESSLGSKAAFGGGYGASGQHNSTKAGLSLNIQASYSEERSDTTNVNNFALHIPTSIYDGRGTRFEYGTTFTVRVAVEFKPKRSLLRLAEGWTLGGGGSKQVTHTQALPKGAIRMIMPEALAPTERPAVGEIGLVEIISLDYPGSFLRELSQAEPITADDMPTDLIVPPALAAELRRTLTGFELKPRARENLVQSVINYTQRLSQAVRGSTDQTSVSVRGTVFDQHVTVNVELYVLDPRKTGEPLPLLKMNDTEGGPSVTYSKGRTGAWGLNVKASGKLPFGPDVPGGSFSVGFGGSTNRGVAEGLNSQSGQLNLLKKQYQEHVGDAVMVVTVSSSRENMVLTRDQQTDGFILRVTDGSRFLRPVVPVADPPAEPVAAPTTPGGSDRQGFPERLDTLPLFSASERLLTAPTADGQLDPSGSQNVMLDLVTELLEKRAPHLLVEEQTTNGARRLPPARVRNMLTTDNALAQRDALRTGLLLMLPSRATPFFHEQVVVRLWIEPDPDNPGWQLGDVTENAIVSRYGFNLNNTVQSVTRSENRSAGGGLGFEQSSFGSVLQALSQSLGFRVTTSESVGHSLNITTARRDMIMVLADAGHYYGKGVLRGEVILTRTPSPVANLFTLGLAREAVRSFHQNSVPVVAQRPVTERVLVSRDFTRPDVTPSNPPPVSVLEVEPTAAFDPGDRLEVTQENLASRRILPLGVEPEPLRELFDQVWAGLTDRMTPRDGSRSSAVAGLVEPGTPAYVAAKAMFAQSTIWRQMAQLLSDKGLTSPTIVAGGGLFTDTHGSVNIRMELGRPRVVEFMNGWVEASDYTFVEPGQNRDISGGFGIDVGVGATVAPGISVGPAVSVGQSSGDTVIAIDKQMHGTNNKINGSWLRTRFDAIVYVTVDARNQLGGLSYGDGTVRMAFRLADAVELGLAPVAMLEHGVTHPQGIPTPAGRYLPSNAVSTDRSESPEAVGRRLRERDAVFSFPPVDDAVVVHVATRYAEDGTLGFQVNQQTLSVDDFHTEVLAKLKTGTKTVVLVGSQIAAPGPDGKSAAARLAELTGSTVVAAPTDTHTATSGSVLTGRLDTTPQGHPFLTEDRWLRVQPDGTSEALTVELQSSLRGAGFTVHGAPALPPSELVRWGEALTIPPRLSSLSVDDDTSSVHSLRVSARSVTPPLPTRPAPGVPRPRVTFYLPAETAEATPQAANGAAVTDAHPRQPVLFIESMMKLAGDVEVNLPIDPQGTASDQAKTGEQIDEAIDWSVRRVVDAALDPSSAQFMPSVVVVGYEERGGRSDDDIQGPGEHAKLVMDRFYARLSEALSQSPDKLSRINRYTRTEVLDNADPMTRGARVVTYRPDAMDDLSSKLPDDLKAFHPSDLRLLRDSPPAFAELLHADQEEVNVLWNYLNDYLSNKISLDSLQLELKRFIAPGQTVNSPEQRVSEERDLTGLPSRDRGPRWAQLEGILDLVQGDVAYPPSPGPTQEATKLSDRKGKGPATEDASDTSRVLSPPAKTAMAARVEMAFENSQIDQIPQIDLTSESPIQETADLGRVADQRDPGHDPEPAIDAPPHVLTRTGLTAPSSSPSPTPSAPASAPESEGSGAAADESALHRSSSPTSIAWILDPPKRSTSPDVISGLSSDNGDTSSSDSHDPAAVDPTSPGPTQEATKLSDRKGKGPATEDVSAAPLPPKAMIARVEVSFEERHRESQMLEVAAWIQRAMLPAEGAAIDALVLLEVRVPDDDATTSSAGDLGEVVHSALQAALNTLGANSVQLALSVEPDSSVTAVTLEVILPMEVLHAQLDPDMQEEFTPAMLGQLRSGLRGNDQFRTLMLREQFRALISREVVDPAEVSAVLLQIAGDRETMTYLNQPRMRGGTRRRWWWPTRWRTEQTDNPDGASSSGPARGPGSSSRQQDPTPSAGLAFLSWNSRHLRDFHRIFPRPDRIVLALPMDRAGRIRFPLPDGTTSTDDASHLRSLVAEREESMGRPVAVQLFLPAVPPNAGRQYRESLDRLMDAGFPLVFAPSPGDSIRLDTQGNLLLSNHDGEGARWVRHGDSSLADGYDSWGWLRSFAMTRTPQMVSFASGTRNWASVSPPAGFTAVVFDLDRRTGTPMIPMTVGVSAIVRNREVAGRLARFVSAVLTQPGPLLLVPTGPVNPDGNFTQWAFDFARDTNRPLFVVGPGYRATRTAQGGFGAVPADNANPSSESAWQLVLPAPLSADMTFIAQLRVTEEGGLAPAADPADASVLRTPHGVSGFDVAEPPSFNSFTIHPDEGTSVFPSLTGLTSVATRGTGTYTDIEPIIRYGPGQRTDHNPLALRAHPGLFVLDVAVTSDGRLATLRPDHTVRPATIDQLTTLILTRWNGTDSIHLPNRFLSNNGNASYDASSLNEEAHARLVANVTALAAALNTVVATALNSHTSAPNTDIYLPPAQTHATYVYQAHQVRLADNANRPAEWQRISSAPNPPPPRFTTDEYGFLIPTTDIPVDTLDALNLPPDTHIHGDIFPDGFTLTDSRPKGFTPILETRDRGEFLVYAHGDRNRVYLTTETPTPTPTDPRPSNEPSDPDAPTDSLLSNEPIDPDALTNFLQHAPNDDLATAIRRRLATVIHNHLPPPQYGNGLDQQPLPEYEETETTPTSPPDGHRNLAADLAGEIGLLNAELDRRYLHNDHRTPRRAITPRLLAQILRDTGWDGTPIRLAVDDLAFNPDLDDLPNHPSFAQQLAQITNTTVYAPTTSINWPTAAEQAQQPTDQADPLPLHPGPDRTFRALWIRHDPPAAGNAIHDAPADGPGGNNHDNDAPGTLADPRNVTRTDDGMSSVPTAPLTTRVEVSFGEHGIHRESQMLVQSVAAWIQGAMLPAEGAAINARVLLAVRAPAGDATTSGTGGPGEVVHSALRDALNTLGAESVQLDLAVVPPRPPAATSTRADRSVTAVTLEVILPMEVLHARLAPDVRRDFTPGMLRQLRSGLRRNDQFRTLISREVVDPAEVSAFLRGIAANLGTMTYLNQPRMRGGTRTEQTDNTDGAGSSSGPARGPGSSSGQQDPTPSAGLTFLSQNDPALELFHRIVPRPDRIVLALPMDRDGRIHFPLSDGTTSTDDASHLRSLVAERQESMGREVAVQLFLPAVPPNAGRVYDGSLSLLSDAGFPLVFAPSPGDSIRVDRDGDLRLLNRDWDAEWVPHRDSRLADPYFSSMGRLSSFAMTRTPQMVSFVPENPWASVSPPAGFTAVVFDLNPDTDTPRIPLTGGESAITDDREVIGRLARFVSAVLPQPGPLLLVPTGPVARGGNFMRWARDFAWDTGRPLFVVGPGYQATRTAQGGFGAVPADNANPSSEPAWQWFLPTPLGADTTFTAPLTVTEEGTLAPVADPADASVLRTPHGVFGFDVADLSELGAAIRDTADIRPDRAPTFLVRLPWRADGTVAGLTDGVAAGQHRDSFDRIEDWLTRHGWQTGQQIQLIWPGFTGPANQQARDIATDLATHLNTTIYLPAGDNERVVFRPDLGDLVVEDRSTGTAGSWLPIRAPHDGTRLFTDPMGRLHPADQPYAISIPNGIASVLPEDVHLVERRMEAHDDTAFDVLLRLDDGSQEAPYPSRGAPGWPLVAVNGAYRHATAREIADILAAPADPGGQSWRGTSDRPGGRAIRLLIDTPARRIGDLAVGGWVNSRGASTPLGRLTEFVSQLRQLLVDLSTPSGTDTLAGNSPARPTVTLDIYAPEPGATWIVQGQGDEARVTAVTLDGDGDDAVGARWVAVRDGGNEQPPPIFTTDGAGSSGGPARGPGSSSGQQDPTPSAGLTFLSENDPALELFHRIVWRPDRIVLALPMDRDGRIHFPQPDGTTSTDDASYVRSRVAELEESMGRPAVQLFLPAVPPDAGRQYGISLDRLMRAGFPLVFAPSPGDSIWVDRQGDLRLLNLEGEDAQWVPHGDSRLADGYFSIMGGWLSSFAMTRTPQMVSFVPENPWASVSPPAGFTAVVFDLDPRTNTPVIPLTGGESATTGNRGMVRRLARFVSAVLPQRGPLLLVPTGPVIRDGNFMQWARRFAWETDRPLFVVGPGYRATRTAQGGFGAVPAANANPSSEPAWQWFLPTPLDANTTFTAPLTVTEEGTLAPAADPADASVLRFPNGVFSFDVAELSDLGAVIRTAANFRPDRVPTFLVRLPWRADGTVAGLTDGQHRDSVGQIADWLIRHGWRTGQQIQLIWPSFAGPANQQARTIVTALAARLDTTIYLPAGDNEQAVFRPDQGDLVVGDVPTRTAGSWLPIREPHEGTRLITDPMGRLHPADQPYVIFIPNGIASVLPADVRLVHQRMEAYDDAQFDVLLRLDNGSQAAPYPSRGAPGWPLVAVNGAYRHATAREIADILAALSGPGGRSWRGTSDRPGGRAIRLLIDTPMRSAGDLAGGEIDTFLRRTDDLTGGGRDTSRGASTPFGRLTQFVSQLRQLLVDQYLSTPSGTDTLAGNSPARPTVTLRIYAPEPGATWIVQRGYAVTPVTLDGQNDIVRARWATIRDDGREDPPEFSDGSGTSIFPSLTGLTSVATIGTGTYTDIGPIVWDGPGQPTNDNPLALRPHPGLFVLDVAVTPDGRLATLRPDHTVSPATIDQLTTLIRTSWNGTDSIHLPTRFQSVTTTVSRGDFQWVTTTASHSPFSLTEEAHARLVADVTRLAAALNADIYLPPAQTRVTYVYQAHQVRLADRANRPAEWQRISSAPNPPPPRFTTDEYGYLIPTTDIPVDTLDALNLPLDTDIHGEILSGGATLTDSRPKGFTDIQATRDRGEFLVYAHGDRNRVYLIAGNGPTNPDAFTYFLYHAPDQHLIDAIHSRRIAQQQPTPEYTETDPTPPTIPADQPDYFDVEIDLLNAELDRRYLHNDHRTPRRAITPRLLAQILRDDAGWDGAAPIRLAVDDLAFNPDLDDLPNHPSFAQQLAQITNTTVYAPTTSINWPMAAEQAQQPTDQAHPLPLHPSPDRTPDTGSPTTPAAGNT